MALYLTVGGPARSVCSTPFNTKHWNMYLKTQTLTIVPRHEQQQTQVRRWGLQHNDDDDDGDDVS